MQIVCQSAGHCHGPGLRRMVVVPMTPPVSDLYPAVALQFSNDLTDLHSPQWSGGLENQLAVERSRSTTRKRSKTTSVESSRIGAASPREATISFLRQKFS